MNTENIVRNLRVLWRTDRIIADIRMRHLLVSLGLRAFAALIAAFGLLMLELSAYFALVRSERYPGGHSWRGKLRDCRHSVLVADGRPGELGLRRNYFPPSTPCKSRRGRYSRRFPRGSSSPEQRCRCCWCH